MLHFHVWNMRKQNTTTLMFNMTTNFLLNKPYSLKLNHLCLNLDGSLNHDIKIILEQHLTSNRLVFWSWLLVSIPQEIQFPLGKGSPKYALFNASWTELNQTINSKKPTWDFVLVLITSITCSLTQCVMKSLSLMFWPKALAACTFSMIPSCRTHSAAVPSVLRGQYCCL